MRTPTSRIAALLILTAITAPARAGSNCIADIDASGVVGVGDLNVVLSSWAVSSIGDINGDHRTDVEDLNLVLANWGCVSRTLDGAFFEGQVLDVCLGFQFENLISTQARPAVGDFNNDGSDDILLRDGDACDGVTLHLGSPDRRLTVGSIIPLDGEFRGSVASDFNNDGLLDAAVATADNGLWLLFGAGDGSFLDPVMIDTGAHEAITLGDFDGDTHPDIATVDGVDALTLYFGDDAATFAARLTVTVGDEPIDVAAADLDDDGADDIVAANWDSADLSLILSSSMSWPAPHNTIAVGVRPHALAIADLNNDDRPDIAYSTKSTWDAEIRFNDPATSFATALTIESPTLIKALIPADIDGDRDIDLIGAGWNGNLVYHINDGTGAFTLADTPVPAAGARMRNLEAGDIDGDGTADLVASGDYLRVLYLDPQGTPDLPIPFLATINSPSIIRRTDMDSDGDLDLVIAGVGVAVYLNDNGAFTQSFTAAYPSLASGLAVADFDADGNLDLVAIAESALSFAVHYRSNGDGTFTQNFIVGGGSWPKSLDAVDIDHDGDQDLIAANSTSDDLTIWLNDGIGTLAFDRLIPIGRDARSLATADIDMDGFDDIAIAQEGDDAVLVLRGSDTDGFQSPGTPYPSANSGPMAVILQDLNRDGAPDLIVANETHQSIGVRLNSGAGTFGPMTELSGHWFRPIAVADVNGDTYPDIIASNDATAQVYLNDGAGSFTVTEDKYPIASDPRALLIFDANLDGTNDLISMGYADRILMLTPGKTPER